MSCRSGVYSSYHFTEELFLTRHVLIAHAWRCESAVALDLLQQHTWSATAMRAVGSAYCRTACTVMQIACSDVLLLYSTTASVSSAQYCVATNSTVLLTVSYP
jgi:hypothetical protein